MNGDDDDDSSPGRGADAAPAPDEIDEILREIARTSDVAPLDLVGRTLGRFSLTARLGAGGMGVVYRARDDKLGRDVALKVLSPSLARDDSARARLLREARAAARVQHAHVAAVYDVGEEDGVAFLALELVEGLNLRDRMRRGGGLPLHEARTIAKGIAAALAAAHEAGVVHRDLKPDNVVLTHAGVKVLDFGLARSLRDDGGEERVTREGEVLGTVGYLSPEQALGKPLDARSDVFSFGVLLYEMLTGRLPFRGETFGEAAVSLANDTPPPIQSLRAEVPNALAGIVERCLARKPRERFPDGAALQLALADAQTGVPSTAEAGAPARVLRRHALSVAAILALVVAGAVAGARWSSWFGPDEPPSLASLPTVSERADVQRRFRLAVLSFYAGDMAAAARALDELLVDAPSSVPALALRVLAGRPESGGHRRAVMLRRLEDAAEAAGGDEGAVGLYLSALWRRVNVDAEGHSLSADASSLLDEGRALIARAPDDYFADLLLTASLPLATLEERVASIDDLLRRDDGPAVLWLWKIWTLQRGERAEDARRTLEQALARHPGNRALRRERGIVAALLGELDVAERELRRVLEEDATDTYARIELAGVLLDQGKEREWRDQLETVLQGPSRPTPAGRAVLASVTALVTQGRFREARPLVERAFALLHDAGRYDVAAGFLVQRASEELLVGRAVGVRAWLAQMEHLIAKPELDDAARRRLQGDLVGLAAELSLLEGDVRAAERDLERLRDLSDEHFAPEAPRERATARLAARIAARRGRLPEALRAFEQAYDGGPRQPRDDVEALAFLARLHRDAGRLRKADALYADVLALRERCEARVLWWQSVCRIHLAEASVSRAELARRRGDRAAARAHLDELAAIWPKPDDDLPLLERASAVSDAVSRRASVVRAAPTPPRP